MKLSNDTKLSNLLYHCLGDCLSSYKDLFSKQTCSSSLTSITVVDSYKLIIPNLHVRKLFLHSFVSIQGHIE